MDNSKKQSVCENKFTFIIICLILFILFSGGLVWYRFKFYSYSEDYQKLSGMFGDYIGSAFAFLGFMALLYTIHLQRQDLVATREEAKEQKNLADDQRKTIQLQRFETSFFNMLNNIKSIIESSGDDYKIGFVYFNESVDEIVNDINLGYETPNESQDLLYYAKYKPKLFHMNNYIKLISNIIELILKYSNSGTLDNSEKDFYKKILCGYLSVHQIIYLKKVSVFKGFEEQKKMLDKLWE